MAGFQRVFEDDGGKVVKKLWPPLVTPDYTPYIAQLGNVDCVMNGFAGSNPVKFMRAYADLGLKDTIPLGATASETLQTFKNSEGFQSFQTLLQDEKLITGDEDLLKRSWLQFISDPLNQ